MPIGQVTPCSKWNVSLFAKGRNEVLFVMPTFQTNPKSVESILYHQSNEYKVPIKIHSTIQLSMYIRLGRYFTRQLSRFMQMIGFQAVNKTQENAQTKDNLIYMMTL
jgi:hypothetical protein